MKYNKLDLNERLLGDDFIVYDWKEDDYKIRIYLKATSHKDICPVCGHPVCDLHNTYHRKIQTYPIRGKCVCKRQESRKRMACESQKIKIASRDIVSAYAAVLNEILPKCMYTGS